MEQETPKRFVSIKTKFLGIYVGIMVALIFIVAMAMPSVFRQYFLQEKLSDLSNAQKLVMDILSQEDFRTNPEAAALIENTADAANIGIWIAIPLSDTSARIYAFGDAESYYGETTEHNSIDFASFTEAEKQIVKAVLGGNSMVGTNNAFPTAFTGSTITVGMPISYKEVSYFTAGVLVSEVSVQKDGALFLHISMEDIVITARRMQSIVLGLVLVVALAALGLATLMTNNVLTPVQKIKSAAEAITKGDFSQEVEYKANDEIGQLAESFNAMSKELKGVDTLQSDFIANISHDFRSPLTSIKGYVEAMLDGTIPPEMHDKYLQIVLDEANRLTKMTNNVLDLTKMENGQIELHRTNFDINEMIVGLALTLEQRVEEKKIQMNFQFLQEKLYVNADYDLMQRVMYNLLDNALKFTSEGDSITVETSIVGKKAYVVVSDTGDGIDEESLPHVFERFNKGDKSRGKNKMGTGLGLAIVKQIMLNHHEDIKVYSKEGEGTRFAFTLPLAKNILVEKK